MQALDEEDGSETSSETSVEEETNTALATPPGAVTFIYDKSKRRATFKKRKGGLMRKAYELSTLTGTQVLVLAVSETGLVYTYTTARLQPLVTQSEGKNLIQAYLRAPPGVSPQVSASTSNATQTGNSQSTPGVDTQPNQDALSSSSGSYFGVDITVNDAPTDTKYLRSERFWLADGNIILSTKLYDSRHGNESRYLLFRVHKSVLAMQSEVFEHMLGSASSDTEGVVNEMYDGLPIVEMPDSRDHVYSLLEVLYGGISLPYKHFDPRAGDTSHLVLEIAAKYEMTSICQRIIAHVEDYWPTTLAAWDIFESRLQLIRDDDRRDDEMDCYTQDPAGAIALARRHDIRQILPAAFYDLSRIPASCDLTMRQARAEDAPEDEIDNDTWNTRAARWSTLSVTDYHRISVGRERLRSNAVHAISRVLHGRPVKGCYNVTRCRDQNVRALSETREKCFSTYDILKVLKEVGETVAVCPLCREGVRNEMQMIRLEVWRDLPVTFSL